MQRKVMNYENASYSFAMRASNFFLMTLPSYNYNTTTNDFMSCEDRLNVSFKPRPIQFNVKNVHQLCI